MSLCLCLSLSLSLSLCLSLSLFFKSHDNFVCVTTIRSFYPFFVCFVFDCIILYLENVFHLRFLSKVFCHKTVLILKLKSQWKKMVHQTQIEILRFQRPDANDGLFHQFHDIQSTTYGPLTRVQGTALPVQLPVSFIYVFLHVCVCVYGVCM